MDYNFWVPFSIGVLSLIIAITTWIKTESWKRRIKISLNNLVDKTHAFAKFADNSNLPSDIKERINGINHDVTYTLSIFKDLAKKWVKENKPENEWHTWEQKFEISMKKHRKKVS